MKLERIDLTQFDKITPGEWKKSSDSLMGSAVWSDRGEFIASVSEISSVNPTERQHAEWNAIAAVPTLIAELCEMRKRENKMISFLKQVYKNAGVTRMHSMSEPYRGFTREVEMLAHGLLTDLGENPDA